MYNHMHVMCMLNCRCSHHKQTYSISLQNELHNYLRFEHKTLWILFHSFYLLSFTFLPNNWQLCNTTWNLQKQLLCLILSIYQQHFEKKKYWIPCPLLLFFFFWDIMNLVLYACAEKLYYHSSMLKNGPHLNWKIVDENA